MTNSPSSEIILNADDFGLTEGSNQAITDLAILGAISSTSLMTNMAAVEAASRLPSTVPSLGIGVHINLTTGHPLTPARSLITESGNFYSLPELVRRARSGSVKTQDVRAEVDAQVERAKSLVGNQLDHWNSHEGIHRYEPFASIAIEVGRQQSLGGMRGHRHFFVNNTQPFIAENPGLKYGVKRMMREVYYLILTWRGRRYFAIPNGILSKLNGRTLDVMHLLSRFGSPRGNGVFELPCHPATNVNGLVDIELKIPRVAEYEFLKSSTWLGVLERGEVCLTTFRKLREK